jgi:hypothetical protein
MSLFRTFFDWLFRRHKAAPSAQEAKSEPKCEETKATETPERHAGVGQTVVSIYRTTNEVAGAILLPDKIGQCYAKLGKAAHRAKWAISHPKLMLAKAHGFFASLWHGGAAWIANAVACVSLPTAIAAAGLVVVAGICVVAMMHGVAAA